MKNLSSAYAAVEKAIIDLQSKNTPQELYEPYGYIMQLGGKRMRPLLTLWGTYLFSDDWQKSLAPAVATEVFHNFSLVHDDIMDNAPLRRGQQTVHEKWDINRAILSGDLMLIESFRLLSLFPFSNLPLILDAFTCCAADVCRGQQFDMNFPTLSDISTDDYLNMIRLKTAVLPAFCLYLGALCADASEDDAQKLYQIGEKIGIAFQIKDDYLDTFGDEKTFGKQTGGDILENKKTILYLTAINHLPENEKNSLKAAFALTGAEKIETVKNIFRKTQADKTVLALSEQYFTDAFNILALMNIDAEKKSLFKDFLTRLRDREM
jgi:geranylgeranyl diphosphate synthase type II